MDIIKLIEIFALVTGVPYIVLEVLQKNSMWYFGIATGLACAYSFAVQHLWSNMALNIYYAGMSVWGLYQWRKDSRAMEAEAGDAAASIHLNRLGTKAALWSLAAFVAGTVVLIWALRLAGDSNVFLDAVTSSMSVVATFWLGRSIPYHWLVWIVANTALVVMCLDGGQHWLAVLYLAYVAAAVYGLFHWIRNGKYVN